MSVVSGIKGADATEQAGKDVAGATDKATQTSWDMYTQSRQDQMPWLAAGKGALADLYGSTTYGMDKPNREDFYTTETSTVEGGQQQEQPMSPEERRDYQTKRQMALEEGAEYIPPALSDQEFSRQTGPTTTTNRIFNQAGYDNAISDYEGSRVDTPGMIQEGPGNFAESEYYQQGLDEEESAINRYLNSRGLYASGKAGKALSANAVSNMNKNRGNWLNEWMQTKLAPLQSLAGVGVTTAGNLGREGSNTAASVGQNTIAGARATGDARIAGANILSGASQNTANAIASYYSNKKAAPAFNSPSSANTGNYGPTQ